MGGEAPANIAVAIGDVNLGPGATAILGTNNVGLDIQTREETVKRCKSDLFVSEPSSVRAELINTKGNLTEGTCRWIRDDETYQSWLDAQDSGLLWISGGPGRGKTMLSIFLTQEWESLPNHVLYVFCGDQSTNDEVTIMRSLLYQVLDRAPSMVSHVEDCMGTGERIKRALSSRGDLWATFANMIKDPGLGPVLCLIDGLDECHRDSSRWLLNNLRHIFDKGQKTRLLPPNPVKLAIVSRDMPGLRIYPRLNLETNTDAIEWDVARVIDAKMKEHDLFSELDHEFITEIKEALRCRSDGAFLWVGFAIQELLSVETKTEMRLTLKTIPRDLGALYSKILLRIERPMRERIAQLLRWVALARHALTVPELADALNLDAQTILDLVAMSRSLLTLSEVPIWDEFFDLDFIDFITEHDPKVVVKLVHASVSDFLKSDVHEDILPLPEFRIHVEEMELQITQRCLREIEALFSCSSTRRDVISYHTFSSYATNSWPWHARRCGEHLERLLDSNIAFFQSEKGRLIRSRWWDEYKRNPPNRFGRAESPGLSLFYVFSALGFLSLAKRLLQDTVSTGNQVDDHDSTGWTALCYAFYGGHTAVAQLLIDHGASLTRDVYQQNWEGQTAIFKPIHKAMELGAKVAEPFLKKALGDISPDPLASWPPPRDFVLEHSLFQKAVVLGNERLIHILCANGATLDSSMAQLVLNEALKRNKSPVLLELLLQHGASIRNIDMELVVDCDPGNVYRRVKALLDHGMDPNSSTKSHPLLHHAVRFGQDLVKLLLDYGARINALDHIGRSALFDALSFYKLENAAILLKHGADLTIKDSHGDTALHFAARNRNPEGVELLLDHGLDVNIRDGHGRTALARVLSSWKLLTAEVLLKHGAYLTNMDKDCDGGGNSCREPGEDVVVKDPYVQPYSFLEAVRDGSVPAVQFLLRYGADVNAQVEEKSGPTTSLRAAIMNRRVDMVQVLLEHGADPNRELKSLGTPLDWNKQFCDEERIRINELLIQRGGVSGRRRRRRRARARHAFTS